MGFWDNLFRREKRETEVVSLNDRRLLELLGIEVDGIDVRGLNALKEATVFACVKIRSEAISKLPLKIYRDDGGISKATDHYLYQLLKIRPNPYMSASDFWKCIQTQLDLCGGNAYAWPEIGPNGKVVAIYPLQSKQVKIFVDDAGLLNSKNKIWYVVTDKLGNEYKLMSDEILHFKAMTADGVIGFGPLDYLRSTVESAASAGDFLNRSFKNGMTVKGIIQHAGELKPDAQERFRKNFEQMANGLKNANRVALMPIGFTFQPIALSMADAQFLENTQLTIKQIASAFGVKNHQLNDLDRATHTNISEQQREFYIDTLMSLLTMYEQELTYKLFTDSDLKKGHYTKFNADAITRADIKTRYEAYRVAIQSGFKTPNEVRALEEDEPKEGGDQLLVNGNMMPIQMAGKAYTKKGGDGAGEGKEGTKGNEGSPNSNPNEGEEE